MIEEPRAYQERISLLEKTLYHKDIQVSFLAHITKEINANASAESLYRRFSNFLQMEMGVNKMLLFFMEERRWTIKGDIGYRELYAQEIDFSELLEQYDEPMFLTRKSRKAFPDLEYIIPVKHKNIAIAYVLLGQFDTIRIAHDSYEFVATIANIIAVAIENKRLFNQQIQQEKFNHEINLAKEVQLMLVPNEWPQQPHFKVSSIYRPLWNIGGDYLDCIEIDQNRTAFCIADVSGKGIAAAMLMANFQAILHQVITSSIALDRLVQELNKAVVRITNGEKIITFFLGEYNKETRILSYINAGHIPPIFCSDGEITKLKSGTTLLGAVEELPNLAVETLTIHTDTTIILYTDGITDLQNRNNCYFEDEVLEKFVRDNHRCNVMDFNKALLEQLEAFTDEKNFPDDIAVLTCKILV